MEELRLKDEKELDNAESIEEAESTGDSILYLTFKLGNDIFGFAVDSVREVMEYDRVFKTPGVPDYIRGVMNLRGEVVPVIDLFSRFHDSKSEVTNSTGIVVVELKDENESMLIGVMIDSVESVTNIFEHNIETVPEIGSKIRPDFVTGIGKVDGQFIILLNVDTVLNVEELSDFINYKRRS